MSANATPSATASNAPPADDAKKNASIPPRSREPRDPDPRSVREDAPRGRRLGLRMQLVVLFTIIFSIVFGVIFYWVYEFTTERSLERLRSDLNMTLLGAQKSIDGDDLVGLYREGVPRADGFSDDPRYKTEMAFLKQVNALEPRAMPYTMVLGDAPDTRRIGPKAKSPEVIYIVDVDVPNTEHAGFLTSDTSAAALESFKRGELVERPDLYTDKFGSWMSSYAPVRDHAGKIVGLIGCDFEASYVEKVQHEAKKSVVIVMAITYVALLFLVYFAAGFFARPVAALTRATEGLGEGNMRADLSLASRGDELGALARAFNAMSRRLARAFDDLEQANEELEDRVKVRTAQLAEEQEKSERLLRNVLPQEIAERLKKDPQTIAEGFEAVTVAFADIVGFTEMSARSSPIDVVRLLNEVFSAFDSLAEKYGLEKIKTIGDAYMVVGGLPVQRDDHAQAVAEMALDMQAFMRTLQNTHKGLAIRIGIHTGPVVAGVIGTKKFSYDLWGDTVNVASRMESHGERDRVQLSDTSAAVLRAEFEIEERGAIKVKGRGELATHWLIARKATMKTHARSEIT